MAVFSNLKHIDNVRSGLKILDIGDIPDIAHQRRQQLS